MMFNRILNNKEMNVVYNYIYNINPKLRSHYLFINLKNNVELFAIDTTAKEYDKLIEYMKAQTDKI